MKKRTRLKIILIALVILLAAAGGLLVPALLHPGDNTEALPASSDAEQTSTGQQPENRQEDSTVSLPDPDTEAESSNQNGNSAVSDDATASAGDTSGDPGQTTSGGVDGSPVPANVPAENDLVNQNWVEAKIAENRHRIADQDLDDFRAIISKLDMNHINDILERRVAPDVPMEDSLRTYLHSRLNPTEYERARELFVNYDYLLFE